MTLSAGIHHIAIITADMDKLVSFYVSIFEAKVIFDMVEPNPKGGDFGHAMVDLGGGMSLHPFELSKDSEFTRGMPEIAKRGHIDHLAIRVSDEKTFQDLRRRLVTSKACDGTETDYGSMKLVAFNDPDGMESEIAIWKGDGDILPFAERIRKPFRSD